VLTPTPTPISLRYEPRAQSSLRPGGVDNKWSASDAAQGTTVAELDWEDAAITAAEDAEGRDGAAAQAQLFIAARISEDRLADSYAAFEHLEAAVARAGGAPLVPVVRALRDLALEAGSILAASECVDQEIAVTGAIERRADLLVEKAILHADHLLVPMPAREAIEEALRLVPGHRGALAAGQGLAERESDGPWLRAILERRLATAGTPAERARVLVRLALLAEASAHELNEAVGYFGRALDEEARGEAAAIARAGLRRAAARTGRDVELLRGLILEAEALVDGTTRAAWLATAASVNRYRLGAVERATSTIELALADEPSDLALLATATEDHLAAGRWRRAVELLDRQSDLVGDPDYAAVLQAQAAHIAEQQIGDDDGAGRRLRRVLAVRPSDPVALSAMERIASRSGDVPLQIELLSAAVGRAEDPGERAALAVRVAELNEHGLADLDTAAAFARRALDAIPGYGPAVQTLDGLYARLGRWSDMLRAIEVEAVNEVTAGGALVGSAEDVAARRLERLGAVYESGLVDPGKAMEVYRRWVDLGVRRSAAVLALLRAAEKAGDSLVAGEAAMKIGLDIPELPEPQRIAWRYRAATLYEERAAADSESIAAFESVLELAPRFRPAFSGLARAYRRMRNWAALADVLSRRAACETSASRAATLEVEAARVHAERLLAPDAAQAALDRAVTLDPGNLSALDARWRLLYRLGHAHEAALAMGALAERLADPAARAAMLRRQAEILEWQLKRPREALASIDRALGMGRFPGTLTAELAQERLLDLVGRHGDAAALQLARLGPTVSRVVDAATGALGRRMDLATRLPDRVEGLRLCGQIVDAMPGDLFALELRVFLAHRVRDDVVAAEALERLGDASREPPIRVAAWRAAIGARARMGAELSGSFELYQRIADADPKADALATFERLATRRGDWPRVLAARQALVGMAADDRTRALRLWELAVAQAELGDSGGAIGHLERARDLVPDLTPLHWMLARLREGAGALRAAAEAHVEFGRRARSPVRAAAALRNAARLYAEAVRDDDAAARTLEELLVLDPEAEIDFQLLEVILKQRGDLDRLIEVARRRAAVGLPGARRDRLLHLAEVLRERRAADAIEPLSAAVALDPHFVPALWALAELFAELGRTAEAVTTYRRVIAVAPDARTVSSAWSRIGEIAAGALGDPALAVGAYRSALAAVPDDVAALSGLTQSLLRQRQYLGAAQALRQLAAADPDQKARVGHLITLGEILAGPARDPEEAADALERALELDPTRVVAMDRLEVVLTDLEDPHRLARALGRHLDAAPNNVARRLRLARLFRGPLASPDRAAEELRTVVKQAPADPVPHAELAGVLEEAGRPAESITEHLGVLRGDPLRLESLRALRRLYERVGNRQRADVVAAVLVALGVADPDDHRVVHETRLRWVDEPRGTLSADDFENVLRHPAERHPATALLATLTEVIPRLHPISLEDRGISRADRLGQRSDDPLRPLVQRLTALFGVEENFEVYLARAGVTQVEAEATFPASLLIPANLMTSIPRREAVLQLARQIARLRAGSYLAAKLSARELGIVLAASLRSRYPDYGRGLASEEALSAMTQKTARFLPRKHRRAFERAVVGVAEAGPLDVNRWRQGMMHTAHRASLIVTGDILGSLEHVIRSDRRLAAAASVSPVELVEAARGFPELVEIVTFVLGPEYLALRAQIA
jgi:cellulose synthase operon protein C